LPWINARADAGVAVKTARIFISYHQANPEIWKEFERLTLELINRGKKHYGAKAVMEVVRFNQLINGKGEFKVNNNFAAYYSRIFALKHKQYSSFFERREVKGLSTKEAA
jgi:hypothetical protein